MIAIPALDLREGASVQLVGGDYANERVRSYDPVATLRDWEVCGFSRVHIVDLDAATDRGSNAWLARDLMRATSMDVQLGGGLRSEEQLATAFGDGARYAVLGTRAVEDLTWLEGVAQKHPGKIIVAADVVGRRVVSRGWQRALNHDVTEFVQAVNAIPLAAVLVTAVHNEGRLEGIDLNLFTQVCRASRWPVQAAGGVASVADLSALAECGVSAAIIGMALHTGVLDAAQVAEEFAQ
ncbi:MAG TPA: 1-(5-phosphoribosyl)-5-[(5-phosphoribosylamino)methylideneamino] imidazole-4-carboxamide isomerase [Gemmatimonadaceae bacterium]|nr:1-(5-phosphoribosyl)-5-[(5-phosphoribosylamino)methylideneamino] imidazole-4-carboxamide isomerase [Gemmatimonadaceae bacterium]